MEFTQSLKATAQQIIELSEQRADRVHKWDQDGVAPVGGYNDRAGFIIHDDIELYADVHVSDDGAKHLVRARTALSPKNEDHGTFTIITLDFESNPEKTKALIADSANLTQQDLLELLKDDSTVTKHIHVSLESGKDNKGRVVGKRYEYWDEQVEKLTEADKDEFLSTLNQAFAKIVSKI